MLESELKLNDFRHVTRVLMADGWHRVTAFRWMSPLVEDGRPNEGIAGTYATWIETINRQTIEVVAPLSSMLAWGFGDQEQHARVS